MKNQKTGKVMGVVAAGPRPDRRGFVILALVLSAPVALVLFGVELLLRWAG